jgi:PAS domain S-box-containing protein
VLAGSDKDRSGALHAILNRDVAGMPQIRRAFLSDATGAIIADSQFSEPRSFSTADRPHFLAHRDDPNVGLYVSEPIQSRVDGDWSITLSRRLNDRDGRFLGVVIATLRPEYFTEIFQASLDVRDTKVVLWRAGGVVMATGSPGEVPAIGARFDMPPDLLPGRQGLLTGRSPVFATERLSAYARSSSYPTVLVVTRPLSVIAAAAAGSERMIIAAGGVVSVLILALGWLLLRQFNSLELRFREGIERMSDGFILWDADERLIAWNRRFESLLPATVPFLRPGVRQDELIRSTMAVTRRHLSEQEREALVAERMALSRARRPWQLRPHDGRILEVQESSTRTGGVVTIIHDITEHKSHEAALERALLIEREANELHRRFVTMASHEFRTPLAVIDGAAQRLLSRAPAGNPESVGRLDRIRSAVAAMTMLIDRTLSSARLEAGSISVEIQTFDLAALLRELCERQRQISPDFEIATSLPDDEMPLEGDPRLLDQVIGNLLSNAVKYSGRSRRIEVTLDRSTDPAAALRLAVRDHGIGIPADEIDRLFTRFFRASTAQGIAGTGIGLHLARELVRLHGGSIEVESRVGEGTRFVVTLPRRGASASADAA